MKMKKKRELILDSMQKLMAEGKASSTTVSDIARQAGIGKGTIYYYFSSKNDIIGEVIERSYSRVLEKGRHLAEAPGISVFEKMKIIHYSCLDAAQELKRQEANSSFSEQQQNALIHQKFACIIITELKPILTDILRQGREEGVLQCTHPEETAHIILTLLTHILDNHPVCLSQEERINTMLVLENIQESAMGIPAGTLQFLLHQTEKAE